MQPLPHYQVPPEHTDAAIAMHLGSAMAAGVPSAVSHWTTAMARAVPQALPMPLPYPVGGGAAVHPPTATQWGGGGADAHPVIEVPTASATSPGSLPYPVTGPITVPPVAPPPDNPFPRYPHPDQRGAAAAAPSRDRKSGPPTERTRTPPPSYEAALNDPVELGSVGAAAGGRKK